MLSFTCVGFCTIPYAFFRFAFAIFVPLVSGLTEINRYVIIFKVNSQQSQKCQVTAITQHAFTMRSVGVRTLYCRGGYGGVNSVFIRKYDPYYSKANQNYFIICCGVEGIQVLCENNSTIFY
jgi:hypothetical protein